jgi:molybdopterin converting factor small subunit
MSSSIQKPAAGYFNILYFATASAFTGKDHEALPAQLRLGDLHSKLDEAYPGFDKILESCLVTRNLDYVDLVQQADVKIEEGDEVAIIPPVSSG